ncbi:RNA-binding domain-containing protein [Punctularia strigosozonata HHB-11173 SS5]|uniref:RNA-binding domain-containing protein n=1 Tax=Punctularia strigosozonata (strain HHB-11173) TaxID=741275 RepID=UPI00044174EC|nr:RNA-binding domain-containing protein [Punctularia strigosozonata HHB-11173 SS5]EIN10247.1 RNA-binding domain-containing protein [Punctularia strigosozonata HHB-11173 SS5]
MYGGDSTAPPLDPYTDEYNAPPADPPASDRDRDAPRRSRSRSPGRRSPGYRSPYSRRSPPPKRPTHAPHAPPPSSVLGVFGLSIRTQERDLDDEFSRFGQVEKVTIVYDQRSGRSRGFGFIKMATVEDATKAIENLNGVDLNGRRIRVDYSVTERPHAPTPGEYMGHRRRRDGYGGRDSYRDRDYRDNDRERYGRDRDHDRDDRDRRDRDPYGRDDRDWRDRRGSPPPRRGYSPEYRRRRSYSRSPPRGGASSPRGRDYEAPANGDSRCRKSSPVPGRIARASVNSCKVKDRSMNTNNVEYRPPDIVVCDEKAANMSGIATFPLWVAKI